MCRLVLYPHNRSSQKKGSKFGSLRSRVSPIFIVWMGGVPAFLCVGELKAYDGAEREQVVNLFTSFAIFPEDNGYPGNFFRRSLRTVSLRYEVYLRAPMSRGRPPPCDEIAMRLG